MKRIGALLFLRIVFEDIQDIFIEPTRTQASVIVICLASMRIIVWFLSLRWQTSGTVG
jgi:hypothetical protein